MSYYLRIIKSKDMEWTGEHNNCLDGEVTEYNNLRKIIRPATTATNWEETFTIVRQDGSEKQVSGHYIGSGREN